MLKTPRRTGKAILILWQENFGSGSVSLKLTCYPKFLVGDGEERRPLAPHPAIIIEISGLMLKSRFGTDRERPKASRHEPHETCHAERSEAMS